MNRKILVLAVVAFTSLSASAESPPDYDALYDSCLEQAGAINNSVVAMCSSDVSRQASTEITLRYQSIYAYLLRENEEDASKFSASQKAWRKYRNSHCELAGTYVGSPMYDFCPMNLNTARALELRELDQDQDE